MNCRERLPLSQVHILALWFHLLREQSADMWSGCNVKPESVLGTWTRHRRPDLLQISRKSTFGEAKHELKLTLSSFTRSCSRVLVPPTW